MVVIDHLDLPTKHIYLAAGVRDFHPVEDIYKEIRTLRRTDESMRGFDTPVMAYGNVPKGGGKFTPRYSMFRLGWKIVPEDVSHILYVNGEMITDAGEPGTVCFDLEPLSPESKVIIQYEPPAAEVIVPEMEGIALEESVQAVKARTDNLPDDPASQTLVNAEIALLWANIGAENAKIMSHMHGPIEFHTEVTPTEVWYYNDSKTVVLVKMPVTKIDGGKITNADLTGMVRGIPIIP